MYLKVRVVFYFIRYGKQRSLNLNSTYLSIIMDLEWNPFMGLQSYELQKAHKITNITKTKSKFRKFYS